MHHNLVRTTARTAVIGAVIVLGSTAAAQGAMAKPMPRGIVSVPCQTPALMSAISGARSGEKLHLASGCAYHLTAALPDIDTGLTIAGSGATLDRSDADGTPDFTILTVDAGDLNLVDLNFRGGGGPTGSQYAEGGAIYNDGGNITVLGGTFTDNSVAGAGGAIFNESGTLTITSAYIMDNDSYFGGAIDNNATMTLRASYFSQNGAHEGGAIDNGGIATVIGTTFTKDTSLAGGALANSGQAALSNVTIQDNWAGFFGGGIYNSGSVTLRRTKVYGNTPDNCDPVGTIAGCSG